jgi:hypothetical protein
MGKLCEYKMCHNLASSTWGGYCNEDHYKRGLKEEEKLRNQTTSSSHCEAYTLLPRGSNSKPIDECHLPSHTLNNPGSKS